MTDFTRKNCNCSNVVCVSCVDDFSKFLHHFLVVLLLPSAVCLVDSLLHLGERLFEHLREVLVHRVDVLSQLGQLFLLGLLLLLLLLLDRLVLLVKLLDDLVVTFFLLLKPRELLGQLLLRRLVLSSHVSDDVVRAFLVLSQHFLLLLLPVPLLLLLLLRAVGLADDHNQLVLQRLLLGLQNEVLLLHGGVVSNSSLLFSLLLSLLAFLLSAHVV